MDFLLRAFFIPGKTVKPAPATNTAKTVKSARKEEDMSDLENKDSIPEVAKKQGEKADQLHRQIYPDQYPKEEAKPGEGTPQPSETPKPDETPKPEEKPKEE